MPSKKTSKVFKLIDEDDIAGLSSHLSTQPDSLNEIGSGHKSVLDRTPLIYAIQTLKFEAAHLILDFGPDLNYMMPVAPQSNYSALTFALLRCGFDQSVFDRIVVDDNLAINDFGVMGENALIIATKHWRAMSNYEDIFKKLIENGADPNARSEDGGLLQDRSSALEIAQKRIDFPSTLMALLASKAKKT